MNVIVISGYVIDISETTETSRNKIPKKELEIVTEGDRGVCGGNYQKKLNVFAFGNALIEKIEEEIKINDHVLISGELGTKYVADEKTGESRTSFAIAARKIECLSATRLENIERNERAAHKQNIEEDGYIDISKDTIEYNTILKEKEAELNEKYDNQN